MGLLMSTCICLDLHRCSKCEQLAPNEESDYVFRCVGRGKHDGKFYCEACLEQKLLSGLRPGLHHNGAHSAK